MTPCWKSVRISDRLKHGQIIEVDVDGGTVRLLAED